MGAAIISYHPRRLAAIEILDGKCERCGFSDPRALTIAARDGSRVHLRELVDITENHNSHHEKIHSTYELICANCTWIAKWSGEPSRLRAQVPTEDLTKETEVDRFFKSKQVKYENPLLER